MIKVTARMVNADLEIAELTAEIYVDQRRKKGKFGLVDAQIIATARTCNAKVITYNNDFSGLSEAVILK